MYCVCVFFIAVDSVAVKEGTAAENNQGKVSSTSFSTGIAPSVLNGANILGYTDTLAPGAGHGGVLTGTVGNGGVFPMQLAALPASYPLTFLRPQQVPLTYALAFNQNSALTPAASTAALATLKQATSVDKNQKQTSPNSNILANQLNTGLFLNSNQGKDNSASIQTGLSKGVPIGQVIGITSLPKQGYNLGLLGNGAGLGLGSTALGSNLNIGLIPNLNLGLGSAGFGSPFNLGLGTAGLGSNLNVLTGSVKTSTDSGSSGANTNTPASNTVSSILKGSATTSGLNQGFGFTSTSGVTGLNQGSNLGKGLGTSKEQTSSSSPFNEQSIHSSSFNSGIKLGGAFNTLQTGKDTDHSFSSHFSSASNISPLKYKTAGIHSNSGHTLNPDVQTKQTGLGGFNFKQGLTSYFPSGSSSHKLEQQLQNNKEAGSFKHGLNSNLGSGSTNFKFGFDSLLTTGSNNNFKHGQDLSISSPQKQGNDDFGFGTSSIPSLSSISNTPQIRHNFNYGSGSNAFSNAAKHNHKQPSNIITGNIGTVKHIDNENHSLGSTNFGYGSPYKSGTNTLKSEGGFNFNTGHEHGGFGQASSFASNFLLGHSSNSNSDLSNEFKHEGQKPQHFENPSFNHMSNFNVASANSALAHSLNTKFGSQSSASSHKGIVLPGIPSSRRPSHETSPIPSHGDNPDYKNTGRGTVKFNHNTNLGTHHIHSTRVNTKVNNIRGPVSFNQESSDMSGYDHLPANSGQKFGATNINKHIEPSTQPIMLQPAFAGNSHASNSVTPNSDGHNRGTGFHSGVDNQGQRKGLSGHGTGSNFNSGGLPKHIGPQKEGTSKFPHVQSAGIGLGSLTTANLPKNVAISTSNFISGNGGPMGHVSVSLHGEPGRPSR
ncbi:hypothetical protein C0J52_17750 [Blattella germanica]|nr:hypothetical protein C0J52_17750 [Blattella germanica]